MSKIVAPPIDEFKSRPRPLNLPYWIMCFLHHNRDRSVPRSEIVEAALNRLYSRNQIFEALRSIDKDIMIVNVGCWWESKDHIEFGKEIKRGEYWRWFDMTEEEVKQRQDDNLWFESLPDHRQKQTV